MNAETENVLRNQLDPGERLLWSGQPRKGLRLRVQDAFMIPFSLLWGGFAIFWELGALRILTKAKNSGFAWIFPLWGIPFVALGLYLILGRFFVDSLARARTYYGLTNERIIIVSGLYRRQVKSIRLGVLHEISFTEKADRSGTITLGAPRYVSGSVNLPASWPGVSRFLPPAFEMIENVRDVYNLIRNAQKNAESAVGQADV